MPFQCDHCNRQAMIHVTEREPDGVRSLHLCEEHARSVLMGEGLQARTDSYVPMPLPVSQAQIDRAEQVSVDLPDGHSLRLKLRRGMCEGWVIRVDGADEPAHVPYEFHIHVTG